ncbi:unnamed protein product [Lepidochelys olivacea]
MDLFFTFHIWVVALGVILGVIFCVLIALASYCSWSQCRAKETLQSAMERQKLNMTLDPDTSNPWLILV